MKLNEQEKENYLELLKQQYESTSKTLEELTRANKEIKESIDNIEKQEGEVEIKNSPFNGLCGFNGGNGGKDTWGGFWGLLAVACLFGLGDKETKGKYIDTPEENNTNLN